MTVEVLYFEGCPNHEPAVERVREVLRAERIVDEVKEVEVSDPETAERLRFPGALASEFFGLVCRTYRDGCCQSGVPSAELIREALRKGE